ncbi:MAG: B12-binding domain-containing radical SAM protein [Candidatus Bathyarchaeota archaeon]|jgi:anaerobic magnesium-protoporphyrin IX monomethyl ester cyclase|nr:B12-binding domain-containing radical SAM protein [Candidatus Bathyarchaeota archaeon]
MKILFIEPPKDIWFVMGEYLPPPFGIIQLAAYLEREAGEVGIKVLDCNAQKVDWKGMETEVAVYSPDVVASSALATCNTYAAVRTLEIAKKVDSNIVTVAGGQHFTATAQESLAAFPEIDVIVRGEGEVTFTELVKSVSSEAPIHDVQGISFRHEKQIVHNSSRPLIQDLDTLPYPGYHFVKEQVHKYHFSAMAGIDAPFALVEGSRGCPHQCTFCSQWSHWEGTWRKKSPERIADEMEYCHNNFGSKFLWLTDDNFGFDERARKLSEELIKKQLPEDFMWFTQARCDDVCTHRRALPSLRRSGLRWVLLGVENDKPSFLQDSRKGITSEDAKEAVKLLKENDIFVQAMFIIGAREDTAESIEESIKFVDELDPDFTIYAILTPFPGTELYDKARESGWIEDRNWAHYDMIHAIMPTNTLSTREVQKELYRCYSRFYGSWRRRLTGLLSRNELKRRVYWYMLGRGIVRQLRELF